MSVIDEADDPKLHLERPEKPLDAVILFLDARHIGYLLQYPCSEPANTAEEPGILVKVIELAKDAALIDHLISTQEQELINVYESLEKARIELQSDVYLEFEERFKFVSSNVKSHAFVHSFDR